MAEERNRLFSVQYMRGWAATLVVFAHTFEHPLSEPNHAFLVSGRYGVEVFFVISGFIITCSVKGRQFSPVEFMLRRIARVVPLYWLVTLLVALLCVVLPTLFKTTSVTTSHLLQSLFFIPHADPRDITEWSPLHKPGWTLIYEMFFYSLMAVLFWCSSLKSRVVTLTAIIGGLTAYGLTLPDRLSPLGYLTDLQLLPFLFGVWIGGLFLSRRHWFAQPAVPVGAGLAFLAFTAIVYVPSLNPLGDFAMTIASLSLLALAISMEERRTFPRIPLFKEIGDSSYSLYLWHMFVVGLGWTVLGKLFGTTGVAYALIGCLIVMLSIIGSHVAFLIVEKPMTAWLQDAIRPRSKPAIVA
ncbi:exopolysaccharide production protein ExoZ [Rhizobium sp. RU20A]|uniref:acyltransferase family protein n=1 Tax=Rhizobium sp. RU20A TaxID=1907412 RepID=UPI000955A10A|nr:acyltransferase [Rhizobium sp. RU20A]SIR11393.1 exopolysaccharide production protein ExoZ [Rhizobium sp. RU20A]